MQIRWRPKLAEAGQVQLGDKSFIRLGGGRSLGLTVTRCWVRGKQSEDKKNSNRLKSHEVQTRHSVGIGQRWTKCSAVFDSKTMWCSEVGSWELGASPTSLSWNRDPGVISKPRSNSSSSNLLEISSPFIIVFFDTCQIVMSMYISGNINRFHLPSQSLCIWQVLTVGRRQIQLSAFASYLPKNIICPERLFAQNYYLP